MPTKHQAIVACIVFVLSMAVLESGWPWAFPVLIAISLVLLGLSQSLRWYLARKEREHKD